MHFMPFVFLLTRRKLTKTVAVAPPAGDGVLLRVVRDCDVPGLHGGGAPGARYRAAAGRTGAAQGRAEGPAGRHPQQVRGSAGGGCSHDRHQLTWLNAE